MKKKQNNKSTVSSKKYKEIVQGYTRGFTALSYILKKRNNSNSDIYKMLTNLGRVSTKNINGGALNQTTISKDWSTVENNPKIYKQVIEAAGCEFPEKRNKMLVSTNASYEEIHKALSVLKKKNIVSIEPVNTTDDNE